LGATQSISRRAAKAHEGAMEAGSRRDTEPAEIIQLCLRTQRLCEKSSLYPTLNVDAGHAIHHRAIVHFKRTDSAYYFFGMVCKEIDLQVSRGFDLPAWQVQGEMLSVLIPGFSSQKY